MTFIKKLFAAFFLVAFSFIAFSGPVDALAQNGIRLPGSNELCRGSDCPGGINDGNTNSLTDQDGIVQLLTSIAQFLTFIAGGIAVLFMVWGGILFITANGNTDRVEKGKNILINASVGLIIAIIAYSIVVIISNIASGNFLGTFL
jgi:hypothetical protein